MLDTLMPIAESVAKRYACKVPKSVSFDELRAAGMFGIAQLLKQTISHFSEAELENYAASVIARHVAAYLRELDPLSVWFRNQVKECKIKPIVVKTNVKAGLERPCDSRTRYQPAACTWDDYKDERQRLSMRDRVILALYCVEKMTVKEIAESLGHAPVTIHQRIAKCKTLLHGDAAITPKKWRQPNAAGINNRSGSGPEQVQ